MGDVQVTYITLSNPQSAHEHVTHLGNPAVGWKWTREQVIASIEAKTNTFFVMDPHTHTRSVIGVIRPAGQKPYLRTYADGDWTNTLLSLTHYP